MAKLRALQEAVAEHLRGDPWLTGVAVVVETPESILLAGGTGADLLKPRLKVLAPAFLLNEITTLESGGRLLRGEALLSVEAEMPTRAAPGVLPRCASQLAEQVLCVLTGWTHGLGTPGVLRAERQAIVPGDWSHSPLSYVMRYAKGGAEKFRRQISPRSQGSAGLAYYLHFWTEIDLSQL